jgi:hypothetical protein
MTPPRWQRFSYLLLLIFSVLFLSPRIEASDKNGVQYGAGLIVNVPAPEAEVVKAVQDVAGNGIIRGSKEYNKDEYISGAIAASESRVFPAWTGGGKVFYKVRLHALDPRNFKDGGDVGTLAVRYIVLPQDETHAILRINAVFVEDFRHAVHQSNGSVEGAEYKDIHDHIEAMELVKTETADAEEKKREQTLKQFAGSDDQPSDKGAAGQLPATSEPVQEVEAPEMAPAQPSQPDNAPAQSLDQRVRELRRQTERLVKAPGAALKSAPFHTATNLQSLPTGTEVLIVISTPYWYGVETHDGQHGWMSRDDLEELP